MKITEKIKSFEDACKTLEISNSLPGVSALPENYQKAIIARYKLSIITEALNEGWKPGWDNHEEYKYYPMFKMYSDPDSGFSYIYYADYKNCSDGGSFLCFKTGELAEYAGKQFTEIYKQYMLI